MITIAKIIGILIALGFTIIGTKLYAKRYKPHPELPRKIVHVVMGCITLTLPWLFNEVWPVITLGVLAILILGLVRIMERLKTGVGSVLHGVARSSLGEIYFPISIVLLFCLSNGDKILYTIPVLMLTFADSAAAMIGSSYGRENLAVEKEDAKTIEGAFIFFVVAFMSTLVPILLWTNIGRVETLLLSLILGFLISLIEVVSYKGNDNLLVPLIGYAFLSLHMNMSGSQLINSFVIILLIYVVAIILNKKFTISKLGIVESLVTGYVIIVLGGVAWFVPPLMLFATYAVVPTLSEYEKKLVVNYRIVESNVAVGLFILWLASVLGTKQMLFLGYVSAFAQHLAINTYARLYHYHDIKGIKAGLISCLKSLGFVIVPGVFLYKLQFREYPSLPLLLGEVLLLILSVIIVAYIKRKFNTKDLDVKLGWLFAGIVALLSSILILIDIWLI